MVIKNAAALELQHFYLRLVIYSKGEEIIKKEVDGFMITGKKQVWGMILASGLSKRMGAPKLLLPLNETTIIGHVISEALQSDLDGMIVVANGHNQELVDEIAKYPISLLVKVEDAHLGMSNSIKKGLQLLPSSADAVMFLLGDQPEMTSAEINKIISCYQNEKDVLVLQAVYLHTKGHPVLFDRRIIPLLHYIDGDMGAREILKQHKEKIQLVEMGRPKIADIDTVEDYQKLLNRWGSTNK